MSRPSSHPAPAVFAVLYLGRCPECGEESVRIMLQRVEAMGLDFENVDLVCEHGRGPDVPEPWKR